MILNFQKFRISWASKTDGDRSVGPSGGFKLRVLNIVGQIPLGQTLSYKEVAIRAGNPKAARSVGAILKNNWNPKIPCHRVITSDAKFHGIGLGSRGGDNLGGYNRGITNKRKLLELEAGFQNIQEMNLVEIATYLDEILKLESRLLNYSNERTELLYRVAAHIKKHGLPKLEPSLNSVALWRV